MKHVLKRRDPSSPPTATLRHVQEETEYTIYPGDTVGRCFPDGPPSSITVEDEEGYVSTVQVQFDIDDEGEWFLRDRSLNGTYVKTGDNWQRVLCRAGRERLRECGEDPTDRHGHEPPTEYGLMDGDLVALVHPGYGVTFEFGAE